MLDEWLITVIET